MEVKTSYLSFIFNYILIFLGVIAIILLLGNSNIDFSKPNLYFFTIIIILLGILSLINEIIYKRLFTYQINEKGVTEIFKFIQKRENFIPYQNISNVKLHKNFLGVILDIGNVEIESTKERISIRGVRSPEKIYQEILAHTNKQ